MSKLYSIVDLATAVPLRSRLAYLSYPKAEPLVGRQGFPDLIAVGPWLVDLSQCPEVVDIWREAGRWQSWGYTVRTQSDLSTLCRHFRKFNFVELEGRNEPVFFRYYDPKVLLQFFRSIFTEEQKMSFKRGIDLIQVEDEVNFKLVSL